MENLSKRKVIKKALKSKSSVRDNNKNKTGSSRDQIKRQNLFMRKWKSFCTAAGGALGCLARRSTHRPLTRTRPGPGDTDCA